MKALKWFKVGSVITLLRNLLGCFAFAKPEPEWTFHKRQMPFGAS